MRSCAGVPPQSFLSCICLFVGSLIKYFTRLFHQSTVNPKPNIASNSQLLSFFFHPLSFTPFPFVGFNILHAHFTVTHTHTHTYKSYNNRSPQFALSPPSQATNWVRSFLYFSSSSLLILARRRRHVRASRCAEWAIIGFESRGSSSYIPRIELWRWARVAVFRVGGEFGRKMRRRAAEYRRPVRRRFSHWIWLLLGAFSLAGLVLFFVQHNHREDRIQQPLLVKRRRNIPPSVFNSSISMTFGSVFIIVLTSNW